MEKKPAAKFVMQVPPGSAFYPITIKTSSGYKPAPRGLQIEGLAPGQKFLVDAEGNIELVGSPDDDKSFGKTA